MDLALHHFLGNNTEILMLEYSSPIHTETGVGGTGQMEEIG